MLKFDRVAVVSILLLAVAFGSAPAHAGEMQAAHAAAEAKTEFQAGDLVIGSPWSRQSPMSANVAAGFLTITNKGTTDDRLLKATAEITPVVQLHDMKMEGDTMKMVELTDGIPVPAGATVELKPRALHVMFMDLKKPIVDGEQIKGTLVFEKAGTVEVTFQVRAANAGMH